jgi:hypothetical protein
MERLPSAAESFDRLHRVGWSVGDVATSAGWVVTGSNGENGIVAFASTQAEVWWRACEVARAVDRMQQHRRKLRATRRG